MKSHLWQCNPLHWATSHDRLVSELISRSVQTSPCKLTKVTFVNWPRAGFDVVQCQDSSNLSHVKTTNGSTIVSIKYLFSSITNHTNLIMRVICQQNKPDTCYTGNREFQKTIWFSKQPLKWHYSPLALCENWFISGGLQPEILYSPIKYVLYRTSTDGRLQTKLHFRDIYFTAHCKPIFITQVYYTDETVEPSDITIKLNYRCVTHSF
jgi:hypothetical protein